MTCEKIFSIITPIWRGSIRFLPILLDSIPEDPRIEIIVVDNSKDPICRNEIDSPRDFIFLHSSPEKHAGGSRNAGMAVAKGRWFIFADADDYFTPDAFYTFFSNQDSKADVIFSKPLGEYEDTKEPSSRGDKYAMLVSRFYKGEISPKELYLNFPVPWCKMIKRSLVEQYNLKYDEIKASNDSYFSLTSCFFAKIITSVDKYTYVVTVNRGSLTKRRDYPVIKARLYATLHCNEFKKNHGLENYQGSVMYFIIESRHFGLKKMFEFIKMIIRYRQNPFIGWQRWFKTFYVLLKNEAKDSQYITK